MDDLIAAKDLTKHKLRHRREADVYNEYLHLPREELEIRRVTSPLGVRGLIMGI